MTIQMTCMNTTHKSVFICLKDRNSSGKDPNYFEPHASSNNPFSSVPIVRGP